MTHVLNPAVNFDIGDDVFHAEKKIGTVVGISLDSDNCYVTTAVDISEFNRNQDFYYSCQQPGRLHLISGLDPSWEGGGFSWTDNGELPYGKLVKLEP